MLDIVAAANAAVAGDDAHSFEETILRALQEGSPDAYYAITILLRANWREQFFYEQNALASALVILTWKTSSFRDLISFVRVGWNEPYALEIVRALAYVAAGRKDIVDRLNVQV